MIKKLSTLLLVIALLIIPLRVDAASVTLSASSTSVTVGTAVTITVSGNAASWNLYISGDGISDKSIADCTSDAENGNFSESVSFTPTQEGTYTIKLTGVIVDETQTEGDSVNKSITITAKAKQQSSNNNGGNSGNNSGSGSSSSTPAPSFSSVNQTVYATTEVNVRSSWSTSSSVLGSLKEGESATRTGIGDNGWSRISFNGGTAYVYSDYLTTTKPQPKQEENKPEENKQDENDKTEEKSSNKYLSTLEIKNTDIKNKLTPNFNKETTQYTLKVPNNIEKLEIDAKAEDSKAKVEISGNDKLVNGSNVVKIKVTAEDGTVRTYVINVEKEAKKDNTGLRLTELTIDDVEFNETFNLNKFEYTAKLLNNDITKLNIRAKASDTKALIEIVGNENIQEGENLITLLVKSQDGKEVTTYQIKVEKVLEEKKAAGLMGLFNDWYYIIIGLAIFLIILILIMIIKKIVSNKDAEIYYDDGDFSVDNKDYSEPEDNNITNNETTEEVEETNEKAEESTENSEDNNVSEIDEKEQNRKEFLDSIDSVEEEKTFNKKREKRKKGKHF